MMRPVVVLLGFLCFTSHVGLRIHHLSLQIWPLRFRVIMPITLFGGSFCSSTCQELEGGMHNNQGEKKTKKQKKTNCQDMKSTPPFRWVSGGGIFLRFEIQGKTSWVDSACADCPGFLVLGAAPAPASTIVSEPQIVLLG